MTPENDMYQSNQINTLTKGIDGNITGTTTDISTMVGNLSGEMEGKINGIKSHIESCVGCVKICGTEPYWCDRCCDGAPYPCNWGCKKRVNGVCVDAGYRDTCRDKVGCPKTRDKCTDPLPKWKCSPNPSGFSVPSFPDNWTGVREVVC